MADARCFGLALQKVTLPEAKCDRRKLMYIHTHAARMDTMCWHPNVQHLCYKQLNSTAKVKSAGEVPDDIPGACVPANPTVSKQRHPIAYQVPVAARVLCL